jgi:hypothetical protein
LATKKFVVSEIKTKKSPLFVDLKSFFSRNGVNPLLSVEVYGSSIGIEFEPVSDNGKFICFCGFNINTETGHVCLGYNSNNDYYIPICNLVDVINVFLNKSQDRKFTISDIIPVIEGFKLDFSNFSVTDTLRQIEKEKLDSHNLVFGSVVLSYLKDSLRPLVASQDSNQNVLQYMDDDMFFSGLLKFFGELNNIINSLAKEFLGSMIIEADASEVHSGKSGKFRVRGAENRYLSSILERGADPDFMREISSVGLGMNRRDLMFRASATSVRDAAILSSWAYVDVWNSDSLKKVPNEKIKSYNLFDLLRAIDKDQHMYFAYDLVNLGSDKIFNSLIKNLKIEQEVASIGKDRFLDYLKYYATSGKASAAGSVRDMGGMYSTSIKGPQRTFAVVGTKSLLSTGKIFNVTAKGILKMFK